MNTQDGAGENLDLSTLVVRPILLEERGPWDELMKLHHYLGFRHLVGESIRYVALLDGRWVALLGWCSAAIKIGPRDRWIGWSETQRLKRLRFIANNSRFLILPGTRIKNLASKTLALNLRRLSSDWMAVHGHPLLLAETFVDHTRFDGACYRAAGFVPLGESLGFGYNNGKYFIHGQVKTILVRPLHRKVREHLSAAFESPALAGDRRLVDLNRLAVDGPGGLTERLASLKDPRFARGVRHSHALALAVIACACLSGAESYLDLGRWSAALPQDLLKHLGCRIAETARYRVPPSEPTLRRALQATDIGAFCRVVDAWLTDQGYQAAGSRAAASIRGLRARDLHGGDG
jgi:hypothetical protein